MISAKDIHEKYWDSSSVTEKIVKEKGPVSRHLQNLLFKLLSEIKFNTVTDAGCGHGTVLQLLHKQFRRVRCLGVDISARAVKEARIKYPDIKFLQHDFSLTPLKEKSDLVMCLDVIEHIEDDNRALKNLALMTKKYLILSTVKGRMRLGEQDAGHVRNYNYNELIFKLESAGFKIIKVIQWGFPFYSPLYRNVFELLVMIKRKNTDEKKKKLVNVAEIPFIMLFAQPLYWLMKLNIPDMGDHIFVLAEKN